MADILIRDIPDDIAKALTEHAQAAGQDRMTYIRAMLIQAASGPIVKKRYAIRFYNDANSSRGLIRRFGDDPRQTSYGCDVADSEAGKAVERAIDFVRRNGPGDREEATWELRNHFDHVFEVPV